MFRLLQSQIDAAKQPSWIEQQMQGEYNNINNFLNSKDYRNLPTGVNIDLLSQSDNNKMREMMMGRDSSDQAAAGTMGRIGQTQKALLNDQAARDWSGAYEEKIGGLMDKKTGLGQFLQGEHSGRMNNATSGYATLLGSLNQRPKNSSFWSNLLGSGIQGGLSMLGGLI